jgi:hypothetical protein
VSGGPAAAATEVVVSPGLRSVRHRDMTPRTQRAPSAAQTLRNESPGCGAAQLCTDAPKCDRYVRLERRLFFRFGVQLVFANGRPPPIENTSSQ